MERRSGDQPGETGKECTIRGSQGRALHLSTEDHHLVSEQDDLDGQIGLVGPLQAEDLNRPEEGEVEKREGHGPFSRSLVLRRMSRLNVPDEVLGTHRFLAPTRSSHEWAKVVTVIEPDS